MVQLCTVPRPLASTHSTSIEWQAGHIGCGQWRILPQPRHFCSSSLRWFSPSQ